jgi:FKBP12-rapamycin complex-associated protein
MLNLLSMILAGRPFKQAGAPLASSLTERSQILDVPRDEATIQLALEVLGTFNFKGLFQMAKNPKSGPPPLLLDGESLF